MKLKSLSLVFLALSLMLFVGCGDDDDTPVSAIAPLSTTTVVTSVATSNTSELEYGSKRADIRANGNGTSSVSGASVTLTLSDGTNIVMSEVSDGKYQATVTKWPTTGGFYINVRKGELELQNLFLERPTNIDSLITDDLSTAFTQIALAASKQQSNVIKSPLDILNNFSKTNIDFAKLRDEVSDIKNDRYRQLRAMVQYALSQADTTATAVTSTVIDSIDKLSPPSQIPTWETILSDLLPFVPISVSQNDETTEVKALAENFASIVFDYWAGKKLSNNQAASFSNILSQDFIYTGAKHETFLQSLESGKSNDELAELKLATYTDLNIVLRKLNDTTYLAAPQNTITWQAGDYNFTREENGFKYGYLPKSFDTFPPQQYVSDGLSPDTKFPIIIHKTSEGWKILGNGIKISSACIDVRRVFRSSSGADFFLAEPIVKGAPVDFKITKAQIKFNPPPALAPYDSWEITDKEYPQYEGFPLTAPIVKNGGEFTCQIDFESGDSQYFIHKTANAPEPSAVLPLEIELATDTYPWKLSWQKRFADDSAYFSEYDVKVYNGTNCLYEKVFYNPDTTNCTLDINSGDINPQQWIYILVQSKNRWGFCSAYWGYMCNTEDKLRTTFNRR